MNYKIIFVDSDGTETAETLSVGDRDDAIKSFFDTVRWHHGIWGLSRMRLEFMGRVILDMKV